MPTSDPIYKAHKVLSSDPFLRAHEFEKGAYDISRGVYPISVRDQMVRAQLLIDRLRHAGLLVRGKRLLVVGGGVAGVAAALWAEHHDITTWLVERDKQLFPRFAACTTRRIDPTLYDWPSPFWSVDEYKTDVPLPWTPGSASSCVQQWREKVQRRDTSGYLTIRTHKDLIALTGSSRIGFTATFQHVIKPGERSRTPEPPETPDPFDIVIFALGIGTEKIGSDQYRGLGFWEKDTFQKPKLGLTFRPRVLIAGAGDGGLQDFIRIITGQHPASIIKMLDTALGRNKTWQDIQSRILFAQNQAERYYCWGAKGQPYKTEEADLCEGLDRIFQAQIDRLQSDIPTWQRIRAKLLKLRREEDLPSELVLAYPQKVFPWCFALNRFLVLLLGACFNSQLTLNFRRGIKCHSELIQCDHDRTIPCHGNEHTVTLAQVLTALGEPITNSAASTCYEKKFDVVILRFGLEQAETKFPGLAPLARQILPLHPRAAALRNLLPDQNI